jgi:hypothetical protein
MRVKVVLDDMGVRKNGAKARVVQKYFFTHLSRKFWKKHL